MKAIIFRPDQRVQPETGLHEEPHLLILFGPFVTPSCFRTWGKGQGGKCEYFPDELALIQSQTGDDRIPVFLHHHQTKFWVLAIRTGRPSPSKTGTSWEIGGARKAVVFLEPHNAGD
jgi:hypothetical protein